MSAVPPFHFTAAHWQLAPIPGADDQAARLNRTLEYAHRLHHNREPSYVMVAVMRQVMQHIPEKFQAVGEGPRALALEILQGWTGEPLAKLLEYWMTCADVLPDLRPLIRPRESRTLDYDPFGRSES